MLEQEGFILCLHMSFLKVHVTALGAPLTFFRSGAKSPFSLFFFFFLFCLVGGFCLVGCFLSCCFEGSAWYLNEASKFSVAPSVPQSALGMLLTE